MMKHALCADPWWNEKSIKYKVKSKIEIKGENVRLISRSIVPNSWSITTLAPWSGASNRNMVGGPLWQRYINRGGGRGMRYEVNHVALNPPTLPTNLGLALVTGSAAATTYPRPRHHPSPWPPARVSRAKEQVTPLSLSHRNWSTDVVLD
jgi:hypothetical protein